MRRFVVVSALTISAQNLPATINLGALPNYENQPVPAYITRDNTTAGNDITNEGATLGRVLFYDRRLSVDDTISCSSCHRQARAFSDPAVASTGVNGTTGRHSMRLVNIRFANEVRAFWDERATSVEDQATRPIQDHTEMGFSGQNDDPSLADLIDKMEQISYYPTLFEAAFGDAAITEDRMQRALAQFSRSIQSFDSRYDTGRAAAPNDAAPFNNFTASENRGKNLFNQRPTFDANGFRTAGGAGCAGCHASPEFAINPNSRNNGVLTAIGGGQDLTNTRSPSLRDLLGPGGVSNGPFMHDGSFATLGAVLDHYNTIPSAVTQAGIRPTVDPLLIPGGNPQRLQLTTQERTDILNFLGTLTGTAIYSDARWSNPFDANGDLTVIKAGAGAGWLIH
jgi:cytochrome c peroxidase